jgi:predicted porin
MGKWDNRPSWALAMALAVGMTSGASAADLGGNCCADLEERIAELEATTARKGNRKVSLEISGWLNKTLLFWDDGIRSDVYAGIDNDAAQSRYRFTGNAAINPDLRAGFVYELGQHGAQTSKVNQANAGDDVGFGPQKLRQANVWLESKRLGKITLGLASQATDGIAEIDLSRTDVVSGSGVDTWIAGFIPNINGVYEPSRRMYFHFLGNFDGGRDQLIRYDTPAFGGFTLSASISGGKIYPETNAAGIPPDGEPSAREWDIALRYAAEWNGLRFAAGAGYHRGIVVDGSALSTLGGGGAGGIGFARDDLLPDNHKFVGSASLLHVPSGVFLTMAAGWMENLDTYIWPEGDVNKYLYVKSGVMANLTAFGQTVFYGEYYVIQKEIADNCVNNCWYPGIDTESSMWGVGVVQHVDAAAMELYAAYRFYDAPNGDLSIVGPATRGDFHMVQGGMRIRF